MNSVESIVQRLTDGRLATFHPDVVAWQGRSEVRGRLERETRELLTRVEDEQFGKEFMAHVPVEGVTDSSLYLDEVSTLADGSLAHTGIRFRGRDADKPFVDVVALEGEPTDVRLGELIAAAWARWARFSPVCLRLSMASADVIRLEEFGPRSRVDLRVIAGRVTDILARPFEPEADLRTELATDTSWYPTYRAEYDLFLDADPVRREWTEPESEDSLAATVGEGLVFLARMRDELAGVYALPRFEAYGLRGFRMDEKFLFESVRGKGLGARVEHEVIGRLPAAAGDVALGSIEEGNQASKRSAYRVGRIDIAVKVWLTPLGWPGMP